MKRIAIIMLSLLGGLIFQSAFSASVLAAEKPVGAELVIPPAETYVIGDSIPLSWRFTNQSTNALGFMWEGCCRVNGRLAVIRNGMEVPPIPPGQALAHMFAKAEVLPPGKSRDFESYLNDWVLLPETGTYELHGRYTGVLDFQKPQLPRGVSLWREAAETGTNRVSVISVGDYLKQRAGRAGKRGLSLELSGPAKLPLLGAADWSLRVSNSDAARPRTFRVPIDLSLWIVNDRGYREAQVPSALGGDYAEITLQPGQHFDVRFKLDYGRMEDRPPGKYQVFVDLQAGGAELPRVPSNTQPLHWEFSAADVEQLLLRAAAGGSAGLRNPALKFLRVHLADFAPFLRDIRLTGDLPKAQELLSELQLASDLKTYAPQPGRKDWDISVEPSGAWRIAEEKLVLRPGQSGLATIQQILKVRRHLGLEMGLTLRPAEKATAATWFATAQALAPVQAELAGPVHLRLLTGSTNTAGVVNLRSEPGSANVVILLSRSEGGLQMRLAQKFPGNSGVPQTPVFSPGDFKSMQPVTSAVRLLELVSDPRLRGLQVQVFCPAETTLLELQKALEPLWAKVNQVDLLPAP